MNTAPATVAALLPAVPSGPEIDLTPLLGADPTTAAVFVLIALVVGAAVGAVAVAHAAAAVVRYRKGSR